MIDKNIDKKESNKNNKIPVTVITGFLGSGKTTLINRILSENHGIRFAIIENEFGELGIDQDLVINEKEEIIEMNNGCICCSVRGDLIRIIKKLVNSEKPPEYILIETTGLADPSPVAQTFLTDVEISKKTFLDSIITVVDAKHVMSKIENTPEAKDQIAFADIVLLNKTDLVNQEEIIVLENKIREINKFCKVYKTENVNVDIKKLFDVGGFDVQRALDINPKFMEIEYPFEHGGLYKLDKGKYVVKVSPNGDEKKMKLAISSIADMSISQENLTKTANLTAILFFMPPHLTYEDFNLHLNVLHDLHIQKENTAFEIKIIDEGTYGIFTEHMPEEFDFKFERVREGEVNKVEEIVNPEISNEFRPAHNHDHEVSSVGIELEGSLDPDMFSGYIQAVVRSFGNELYRFKGIMSVKGHAEKVTLQGVHMLYEMKPGKNWDKKEQRKSTIIFIGKNLDRNILTQGFISCKYK